MLQSDFHLPGNLKIDSRYVCRKMGIARSPFLDSHQIADLRVDDAFNPHRGLDNFPQTDTPVPIYRRRLN